MNSYFYLQADQNTLNANLIERIQKYSDAKKTLIYVLNCPLTDQKYSYKYSNALIILSPKHKICIIDCGNKSVEFQNYIEDVIEDIGSISDKYLYKNVIGRPRTWRTSLLSTDMKIGDTVDVEELFSHLTITDENEQKKLELLISLFIGSINDISRVKEEVPRTTLDRIKQKIQLFDADQTRFVYQKPNKKRIRIQGLSGTGKTELLLHKLKDLYTTDSSSSIYFTCHNKILADNLRRRIPSFFNFMKVEQQIEWGKRLWCTNAWGSSSQPNSGAYRYICAFYQIPFHTFSYQMSFTNVCKIAIDDIKSKYQESEMKFAFTYMFIDESQDFDDNFFELCELVTMNNIYVAGDIFQSIFDRNISSTIEPDFLLGKCYRTDPKTLMFAHALGMGLFEKNKLRWLEEKEWKDCGYNVTINNSKYYLSREPLRRFEDLEDDFESIRITEIVNNFSDSIIQIIEEIVRDHPTVTPDDIGIILLDQDKSIYQLADILQVKIQQKFNWVINKAYETKEKRQETLLISNRNNVKGLEFPFVICVTRRINDSPSYRNSIYTMLTRSFIKSFLLIQPKMLSGLTDEMFKGLKHIITKREMIIQAPSESEIQKIRTRFEYNIKKISHYDLMMEIFTKLNIDVKYHDKLIQATQQMEMVESDEDILTEFIKDNVKYVKQQIN